MKLELTFTEKMLLTRIFPAEDNFKNLIAKRDLDKKIGVTQKDIKNNNYREANGLALWDDKGKKTKYELTDIEEGYIKEKLTQADEKNAINAGLLDVYEKIVI
jgi:hypothetical protein